MKTFSIWLLNSKGQQSSNLCCLPYAKNRSDPQHNSIASVSTEPQYLTLVSLLLLTDVDTDKGYSTNYSSSHAQ